MRLFTAPLAALAACGTVEQSAPDGSTDANGTMADAGEIDAAPATPGEVRWVLSLSALFGLGVAEGPGSLVVTGSISAPADLGDETLVPRSAADMVIAGVRASDASYVYAARHGEAGMGQSYGFLDRTDSSGSGIVYGVSYGDVDLGRGHVKGGGGVDPANPPADGFIGRYSSGAPPWIERAVGPGEDKILTTARAQGSRIYGAGYFEQTTTVGGQSLTTRGGRDLLLLRVNGFGGAIDLVRTYGDAGRDEVSGAAGDGATLFLVGFTDGTLVFDEETSVTASGGGLDVWVARFEGEDVDPAWAVSFGGTGEDRAVAVAQDGAGDLYVTGEFRDQIAFGAVNLTARGESDIFVAKLGGAAGAVLWAVSIGTAGVDRPLSMALDGAGNAVVAGTIGGALDDEPALGGPEALFVSLDGAASGAVRWRKVFSTGGDDYGWDVTVGASGDLFALVNLGGTFDFGGPIIGPDNPASALLRIAP